MINSFLELSMQKRVDYIPHKNKFWQTINKRLNNKSAPLTVKFANIFFSFSNVTLIYLVIKIIPLYSYKF